VEKELKGCFGNIPLLLSGEEIRENPPEERKNTIQW
jgi:hypothetical protein